MPPWELREPVALAVVAGLVVLVIVRRAWGASRRGVDVSTAGLTLDGSLRWTWRDALAWVPDGLMALGLLLLGVALAQPIERVPLPDDVVGIDIIVALDTSSSMTARDLGDERTRLDVARDAAKRFVAARTNDRIGVVSFARFPDLRCPPTIDHRAVAEVLDDLASVDPDGLEDATGIGTAVARSASALSTTARPTRVVVLLTDGEENVASTESPDEIAPIHAAQLCEELGVRVYTIVAGDVAAAGIDTTQVRRVASRTGGLFFEARDASAIDEVYAVIDTLERAPTTTPKFGIEHRFSIVVAAAFVSFALGRMTSTAFGALA